MPTQSTAQRQAALDAAGLNATQQSGVTAGIGYAPPTSLNSGNLAPQSQVQMPPAPTDTNNYSGMVGGTQATITTNGATLNPPVDPNAQNTQDSNALFQNMMDSITAARPQSSTDLYNGLDASSGINAKSDAANVANQALTTEQGKLAALQASLNGKNYEFNTVIPNQAQQDAVGRNGTQAGVQATTVSDQRKKLLEIAPLQLQVLSQQAAVAAAQGNASLAQGILQSAQAHVDKLFQIQSADAQAQYDYKTKQIEAVYNYASAQQKAKLDAQQHKADQDHADQQAALKNAQEYAKLAIDSNQPELAAQITALDPKSKTYSQDLAKLQSQLKMSPQAKLDLQLKQLQIAKAQKELSLLGEPTPAETKATKAALLEAKSSIPVMQDKIQAVDVIKNLPGLVSRVGTGIYSRAPQSFLGGVGQLSVGALTPEDVLSSVSGSGQQFAGAVHKLTGGLTLQTLIDAKARGATFGALSEGELKILSDSATALNDWEIKDDNGKGTGFWDIDEGSFKKEMDTIKELTQRALFLSQGSVFSPDEQAIFDSINQATDPASYYN
jgi:hypothetical protein